MRFLKFLIVVVITVAVTLLCVWFFDCESCESCEGCDSGKVHISCESKGDEDDETDSVEYDEVFDEIYVSSDMDDASIVTMSVKALFEDLSEDIKGAEVPVTASPAEGEAAELSEALEGEEEDYVIPTWLTVTFDVVVIAATVGVIVLIWFLYKKFMKSSGGTARRFG